MNIRILCDLMKGSQGLPEFIDPTDPTHGCPKETLAHVNHERLSLAALFVKAKAQTQATCLSMKDWTEHWYIRTVSTTHWGMNGLELCESIWMNFGILICTPPKSRV